MGRSVPQNRSIESLLSGLGLLCSLLLAGCSESTNIMGLIADSSARKDPAALLSRSLTLFDKGDYPGALRNAEAALDLAPDCGACAVQVGYCHLGVAGLDIFQLARKMLEKAAAEDGSELAETSNASGQLGSLGGLVGLEEADFTAITLEGNRLGTLEGAPSSGPFRSLPVYLPKTAPDARLSDSSIMQHIARAAVVICPFMPDAVKILGDNGDIRHNDPSCQVERDQGQTLTNGLFIWAISHLVEAIAFHQVVLYAGDGAVPNLQKRAAILQDRNEIPSLAEYVGAVVDLAAVVDIILPTESNAARASMLTAMFNDLETVSLAFQNMAAVPAEISQGIIDAIAQLKGQRDQLDTSGGGAADKDQTSVAFKDQLTEGMAAELKDQITKKIDAGDLSAQERTDLCAAYRQISTQTIASCDSP